MSEQIPSVQIRTRWPRDAAADVVLANQILLIEGPGTMVGAPEGGVYLLLGHLAPPILSDEAAMQAFITSGGALDVTPRGAFYVTKARLQEFYNVIGQHLAQEQAQESAQSGEEAAR